MRRLIRRLPKSASAARITRVAQSRKSAPATHHQILFQLENVMPKGFRHGLRYTPEYRAWIQMRQRCTNKGRTDYCYYGGRGISICDEWSSVEQFIKDMGSRPSKRHQLDRRDNNGNYHKENCHWVERKLQMQNTRISKRWFVYGVRYPSLSVAAESVGVTVNRIKAWCEGRTDGGYTYPPKANCWSEKKYD